jgi:TRAP-type C4-dicarboxylate transport system permease small subunit
MESTMNHIPPDRLVQGDIPRLQIATFFRQWILVKGAALQWAFAGLLLISQVFIIVVDTLFRYTSWNNLFAGGAMEIVELQMGLMTGLILGNTWLLRGHIRIELLHDKMNPRGRAIVDLFAGTFGLVYVGGVVWGVWWLGLDNLVMSARTDVLELPVWPAQIIFSVALGHFGLILASYTYQKIWEVFRPQYDQAKEKWADI